MIVGYQPGGTIGDARVVLRPDELLPNKYNTNEAVVYREDPDNNQWALVKPKGVRLAVDSPLLSQPEVVATNLLDLTMEQKESTFEHVDIIRFEEKE